MILPDTSVWVEYLRTNPAGSKPSDSPRAADELDRAILQEQVLACGPVVAELLVGALHRREELERQLGAQPWIELRRGDWLTVGHTAARLRERGETTPLVDVQIAVCAVKAQAELWTRDGDFERIAQVLDGLHVRAFS